MRHLLAYGNSDQASFRNPVVRDCFDFMTVPGTIASYYSDATAAFVLTADIPYLIDPRTPLFQDTIHSPRASHYSLAEWLDIDLEGAVYAAGNRSVADFPPTFYTNHQLERTVHKVLDLQFSYGGRSVEIQTKLDRYRSLMNEALGVDEEEDDDEQTVRPPDFALAPYFMSASLTDPWWDVNLRIWNLSVNHTRGTEISPVVAVTNAGLLQTSMNQVPAGLADTQFFWISDFDERRVDREQLADLAAAVSSDEDHRWVNLYGGFFSIALGSIGLWGFSNGLGYSESRAWPQLEATGGAPPRYYIPRLHTFTSVANAQLLYQEEPWFFEPITQQTTSQPIPTLSYHELKRDFALARQWEIDQTQGVQAQAIAQMLEQERARYLSVEPQLPARLRLDTRFLERWADVLSGY